MANVYKIQNRTENSHRVLFQKNGGTVSFPGDVTSSFVENNYEAGFCLTAITPIPTRDGIRAVDLPAHPIGVDGRVSIYVDGALTETKRYDNLQGIDAKVAWFNTEFGGVVNYSTIAGGGVRLTTVNNEVEVIVVFEDDDIDYQFNGFTASNPVVVEQYRLAAYLYKDIQISCDGAPNSTGCIEFDDNKLYTIYLNLSDTPTLIDATPQEILEYFNEDNPTDLLVTECEDVVIGCEGATTQIKLLSDADAVIIDRVSSITVNGVDYPRINTTLVGDAVEEAYDIPSSLLGIKLENSIASGSYIHVAAKNTNDFTRVTFNDYRGVNDDPIDETMVPSEFLDTNPTVVYAPDTVSFCLAPIPTCVPIDLEEIGTPLWYLVLLDGPAKFVLGIAVSLDDGRTYNGEVTWKASDEVTDLNYWIAEAIKYTLGDIAFYPVFMGPGESGYACGRITDRYELLGSDGSANSELPAGETFSFTVQISPVTLPDVYDIGQLMLDNNTVDAGVIYSSCGVTRYLSDV